MKNKLLSYDEKVRLLRREKGNVCISLVLPTHQLSPDNRSDSLIVSKAIEQVRISLENKFHIPEVANIMHKLYEAYREIDFNNNTDGIGIYVSKKVKILMPFFFPVKEKIIISDSFDIKEILYQDRYASPYFVLFIEQKRARLFKGKLGGGLHEISDANFPKNFSETYEYSRPSRGTSYVGHAYVKEFERDKSIMEEIRLGQFSREVDNPLSQYLQKETLLLLAGTTEDIGIFKKASDIEDKICGELPGNYLYTSIDKLEEIVWSQVKSYIDHKIQGLILDFREKIGQGLGESGLPNAWRAAVEGRGLVLLVEKDYSDKAYLVNGDNINLHLQPPTTANRVIPDAVSSLIEIVLDKNGRVIVVENGSLKDYQQIALITRY